MDYCEVTRKIKEFPFENVKKWGIERVRDLLAYKAHLDTCEACQQLTSEVLEEHKDVPPSNELGKYN